MPKSSAWWLSGKSISDYSIRKTQVYNSVFFLYSHTSCRVDLSTATVRVLFVPYWISLAAGPVSFISAILHISLGSRYPLVGRIMESIVSFDLNCDPVTVYLSL